MFERARALEEGAVAARLARGGHLLAGFRDWRAARLLERSASIFDARKELRAERALALYRASWVGRLRAAAYTAKGGRLLDRAVHAADAGRIARSERLFARAGQAERLASDLSRASLVNRAWTAYRINSISGFSLRMVDKAALDPSHDPTKGWR